MHIYGEIKGIKYKPFLCAKLESYDLDALERALSEKGSFMLKVDPQNELAVSWWVSPKRTRSYPYARVYDTLSFTGKKITIIPIIKDEGEDGDRDFLQWDTVSLMSLLGVYVIVAYYISAEKNLKYGNKITNQKFDVNYIKDKIHQLISYRSDALHWNLEQVEQIPDIANKSIDFYKQISERLGVEMHSEKSALRRIEQIQESKKNFMKISRELAHKAQIRETATVQPKEHLSGNKAAITIKNYLGGYYFFTCDEAKIRQGKLFLVEGKHTKAGALPSTEDIKDGLIKMVLFTNFENVIVENRNLIPVPVLKLTTKAKTKINSLSTRKRRIFELLKQEAKYNGFRVRLNDRFIV